MFVMLGWQWGWRLWPGWWRWRWRFRGRRRAWRGCCRRLCWSCWR